MADEDNKVTADTTTEGVSGKSVKKKSVKKTAKKSVKKKSVKKSTKKAVVKSAGADKAVASTVDSTGNGQREKAKIRLKDEDARKEKTVGSSVKVPAKKKKDRLGLLSTVAIALLIFIGIWTIVSYMSDNDVTSDVTSAVETEITEETAPSAVPATPSPEAAEAVASPSQAPMQAEKTIESASEAIVEGEVNTAQDAAATGSSDAEEKSEESGGFFDSIFGRKNESAEEVKGVSTEEAAVEETVVMQPSSAQENMPQPYGQPAPWGSPPPYGRPAPWGPPQGFGGPPPGFYDMPPPPMPMYDQGSRW